MTKKRINLALQGGGAHGAFTWGVLERLLEHPDLEIAAISATSAGAMNGAALKAGWVEDGAKGAVGRLNWLWTRLGAIQDMRMTGWMADLFPDAGFLNAAMELSFPYAFAETLSRMTSPYGYGPFYSNPLEPVAREFDYDKVCCDIGPRLFIGATNVRSGAVRVFSGKEISTDVLLASSCLPTIFQAVEIEDPETGKVDVYWDGGYTGNPALFPLFATELPDDILIVNINPLQRDEIPVTPQQINNRINEISFNTSLLRELRVISYAQKLESQNGDPKHGMARLNIHMIADDALMNELSVSTKMLPSPFVLLKLKSAGRKAADQFLETHFDDLNTRSSVDLNAMFG
ncbi:patatin-like phospholipase family protein [Thalassovita sp.]|uniref:patatin-like phospholipase family protein n=1 Tax=Thalassovita sp. TaxID=1979401 RepID=UPI002B2765C9|nr:patatin-like phospholipase family protein [Thalassovita sp.]